MLDAINIPCGDDHLPFKSFPGTQPIGPPMHLRDDISEIPDPPKINKGNLQELIEGLSDGIILVEQVGCIVWANAAAIAMHRVSSIEQPGGDAAGYRRTFTLRYRNNHLLEEGQYPMKRLLAGETVDDVTVEISPAPTSATSLMHWR